MIPAGNIDSVEYWKKLSMINWSEMFYSEKGQGVRFILDLKAKIEKEIAPDILLIDSRTVITDISGITLKLLADEVVILSSYNDEGLFGSKKIIKSLLDNSNILIGKAPRINFILTRLPFKDEPSDKIKENTLLSKVRKDLTKSIGIREIDFSIIHSDRRLEENERQLIGYDYVDKSVSISNDYLKLFDKLTFDILSTEEIVLFKNKKNAEKEYNKSLTETELPKRIQYLNKAIELDSTKWEYYYERGYLNTLMDEFSKAIEDFKESLKLNSNNADTYNSLAYCYSVSRDYAKAIDYSQQSIKIKPKSIVGYGNLAIYYKECGDFNKSLTTINKAIAIENMNDRILNSRADLFRLLGDLEKAYVDIYKAIEINPKEPVYFGTLAEIFASEGKIEEFYYNLNIALGMGLKAKSMKTAMDIYKKFKDEERFKNLLKKYDIEMDEIIGNGS
jgi:tetratricopeptide (TPR) repeat protein